MMRNWFGIVWGEKGLKVESNPESISVRILNK